MRNKIWHYPHQGSAHFEQAQIAVASFFLSEDHIKNKWFDRHLQRDWFVVCGGYTDARIRTLDAILRPVEPL
jgi:hypothetical protein